MDKIRKTLCSLFERIGRIRDVYPLTLILVILLSLSCALFIDQDGTVGRFMENYGIPFLLLWGIGTFFTETLFAGRKPLCWMGVLAAGGVSALLTGLSNSASEIIRAAAEHWMWAYALTMILLGIYFNYRTKRIPFEDYCFQIIHDLTGLGIICFITGLGTALVVSVFVTLILNGEHYMLVLRTEFLVLGCLLGGGIMNVLVTEKHKTAAFFGMIVKYLLMGLLLAAFAVVYGYMLKILITRDIPSNEIFRILAGLFIIGLPIWTMAGTFEPGKFPADIGTKLPYVFIPFLFLQGYAIRERILAYGMTPARYLCLVLMVFEILYIVLYAVRKRETAVMLPIAAGLALCALVCPKLNMFEVSLRSQKKIFDTYAGADFAALSREDQSSLAGAFYYLEADPAGKRLLEDVPEAKIEMIRDSGLMGIPELDQNFYIMEEFPLQREDLSGYRFVTSVYYDGDNPAETDLSAIPLHDGEEAPSLTLDLDPYIDELTAAQKENAELPKFIRIDDQSAVRVLSLNLMKDPAGEIQWFYLSGLLLEK